MFARVGGCARVCRPSAALIFLFGAAFRTPSFLCVPAPAFPSAQILILHTALQAGCWEVELHPSISILLPSRGQSLCPVCFILLSISLCRSHLLSPHWLFSSDSLSNRISFRGISSLRKKLYSFAVLFSPLSCFLLHCLARIRKA